MFLRILFSEIGRFATFFHQNRVSYDFSVAKKCSQETQAVFRMTFFLCREKIAYFQ